MKKTILQHIQKAYEASREDKGLPSAILRYRREMQQEAFTCQYHAGEVHIHASNERTAAYALSLIPMYAQAGHLGELAESWQAALPVRPLLLVGDQLVAISDEVACFFPVHLIPLIDDTEEAIGNWAAELVSLGYNAVIFTKATQVADSSSFTGNFARFVSVLQNLGLAVGIQPTSNPSRILSVQQLVRRTMQQFPAINYLYWVHNSLNMEQLTVLQKRRFTSYELALQEVQQIETLLPNNCRLIFCVEPKDLEQACKQSLWLSDLGDQLRPSSYLAFPALAGPVQCVHPSLHPYWQQLKRSVDCLGTRLLPIVNAGAIGIGEGYWPVLTTHLIESILPRMRRHAFSGIACLAAGIPRQAGFARANLWIWGTTQWQPFHGSCLAETWFQGMRPDLTWEQRQDTLRYIWEAACLLSELQASASIIESQQKRIYHTIERLLPWINRVQKKYESGKDEDQPWVGRTTFSDYLCFFIRDLRHSIEFYLDSLRLSSPFPVSEGKIQAGIWTQPVDHLVKLSSAPRFNPDDARMTLVFHENYLGLASEAIELN